MRLSLKQLKPFYLISGDEPLLVQEARDLIITAAQSHGFSEKTIHHIEPGFHTETLVASTYNGSLFSEKKLIDIRNPNAKVDADLLAFLEHFFEKPTDDCIVIMSTDKLSAAQQKTNWFEHIKKHGVFLPIWPIRSGELTRWITERAKHHALTMSTDIAQLLANFTEGNLLSAQQALQKLALLYPNATISREQLITVLSDHARFNIFDLSESLFSGNTKRIARIIARLQQTGEEPTLVLWAICRKLRENSASAKVKNALQKAAHVDEIIKGAKTGEVWQAIMKLCLIAGARA